MPDARDQVEHERKRHLASPRCSQPTQTSTGRQARSSSTPRKTPGRVIETENASRTTDRDRSTGHRFYSDGTHVSEQGMAELVAALKIDVLEAGLCMAPHEDCRMLWLRDATQTSSSRTAHSVP